MVGPQAWGAQRFDVEAARMNVLQYRRTSKRAVLAKADQEPADPPPPGP